MIKMECSCKGKDGCRHTIIIDDIDEEKFDKGFCPYHMGTAAAWKKVGVLKAPDVYSVADVGKKEPKINLPDYITPGSWVYVPEAVLDRGKKLQGYYIVREIESDTRIIIGRGDESFEIHPSWLMKTRVVEWTPKECRSKVGKGFDTPDGFCVCVAYRNDLLDFIDYCHDNDDIAHLTSYNRKELLSYGLRFEDLPCGTMEHKTEEEKWER